MSYCFRALRGMEKVKAQLDIENPSSRAFFYLAADLGIGKK